MTLTRNMICVLDVMSANGAESVGVIVSQDAIFTTAEGTPFSGVALTPERARQLAREMIVIAERIEKNGS